MVGRHIQLCEKELGKLKATAPRVVTMGQRLLDMLLLACMGMWVYYALGMGQGEALTWGSSSSSLVLLPLGFGAVEQAVAVMLLLAAAWRVVCVKAS